MQYSWTLIVGGRQEKVYWDSVSLFLEAPPSLSFVVSGLIEEEQVLYLTPVGPRVVASLDDELAAWATIAEAIDLCGYEVVNGSPCPIAPEMNLLNNPTSG